MYKKFFDTLIFLIVTVLGLGKIKYAPGTFGSLAAYPIIYLSANIIMSLAFYFNNDSTNILQFFILILLLVAGYIVVLFIIGLTASYFYMLNKSSSDPQEIVVDELVGQLLTILITAPTLPTIVSSKFSNSMTAYCLLYGLMPFLLFRLYDIKKPWPIGWLDKNIKGAIGVMIDDIAAAILAGITNCALIFIIVDFLK